MKLITFLGFLLCLPIDGLHAQTNKHVVAKSTVSNNCEDKITPYKTCFNTYYIKLTPIADAIFFADCLWIRDQYTIPATAIRADTCAYLQVMAKVNVDPNKNQNAKYLKPPVDFIGEGLLRCSINNQTIYIDIPKFEHVKTPKRKEAY